MARTERAAQVTVPMVAQNGPVEVDRKLEPAGTDRVVAATGRVAAATEPSATAPEVVRAAAERLVTS